MADDGGQPVDRLREHLIGASRLDALSESFSVFVHNALKDELVGVDVRLALWQGSLTSHPLNGLAEENLYRACLDQHRIAREFVVWAEQRMQVRALSRRMSTPCEY